MSYLRTVSTLRTLQTEPIPGSDQVQNHAGGYAWQVDDWTRLDRFLILGSSGGTYYVRERKLARENADAVLRCLKVDGPRVVRRIGEIVESGRASKADPALFALAMAAGLADTATRAMALQALPTVARIGTHLLHFAEYVQQFRGWGRGLRRAIVNWYDSQPTARLAYQAIKYQERDGWRQRDLLRLAHPKESDEARNAILHWIVKGWPDVGDEPHPDPALCQIWAFERAKRATDVADVVRLIRDYRLPREAVPTIWLQKPEVWEALLDDMPMTALIRNLATMTRAGLIAPGAAATGQAVAQLGDAERLVKARIHPIAILSALKTYAQGYGERGKTTWTPVSQVVDALDAAFYTAFKAVAPTNKRWLLALDVSGSMGCGTIAGTPGLTPRVASAAMALVTASTERQYTVVGFSGDLVPLDITPRRRLDDVLSYVERIPMGRTDCALPMLWALKQRIPVDVFAVYTDSETWAGVIHPMQALRQYRHATGNSARLIVVGMTSTGFSIADPEDFGALDVTGFDTATPGLMADFATGNI